MDKEERGAITDYVTRALRREQGEVLRRPDAALDKEGDVAAALATRRRPAEACRNMLLQLFTSSEDCFYGPEMYVHLYRLAVVSCSCS